jgi:sterol desaturase/sphingolipid hydroxylase (fatty acid hydroxylase superfamily)
VSPTPWAIFAFNPLEAFLQFCGVMGLVIFLPMRPLVLLGFLSYDTIINTAGHTGYEMVPKPVSKNWFFKYFNTVTNHDDHHTNVRVNYGAFFSIWDRLMGTYQGDRTDIKQDSFVPLTRLGKSQHEPILADSQILAQSPNSNSSTLVPLFQENS